MKKIAPILFFLIVAINSNAQEIDSLVSIENLIQSKLDSLEVIISNNQSIRDSLENQLTIIKIKIETLDEGNFQNNGIKTTVGYLGTEIRDAPFGKKFMKINKGDTVYVIGIEDNFYRIKYNDVTGFVGQHYLEESQELEQYLKDKNPKLESLINRYGEVDGRKIYNGRIWIGMTDSQARISIGRPNDINRSVGEWGTHEQWVYNDGRYLYFENGKLTSWQN